MVPTPGRAPPPPPLPFVHTTPAGTPNPPVGSHHPCAIHPSADILEPAAVQWALEVHFRSPRRLPPLPFVHTTPAVTRNPQVASNVRCAIDPSAYISEPAAVQWPLEVRFRSHRDLPTFHRSSRAGFRPKPPESSAHPAGLFHRHE